ncbi:transposase family protein [Polymorphospora lycopeni]|uniref:Transposase family protein n=1 Tax=Polymorphospora lycopeni TaxID=3140240 RepID=A0ABV5D0N1_9ACTN
MPALPSSLISPVPHALAPALAVPEAAGGLLAVLADPPDPRAQRGVRYGLAVVVTAAVCAVVAGSTGPAIAEWIADVPAATAVALGM